MGRSWIGPRPPQIEIRLPDPVAPRVVSFKIDAKYDALLQKIAWTWGINRSQLLRALVCSFLFHHYAISEDEIDKCIGMQEDPELEIIMTDAVAWTDAIATEAV